MSYEQDAWKTRWDLLQGLLEKSPSTQRQILERLACQYWRPIFWYIRRKGYSRHRAEELTQEFFCQILQKELFAKADKSKGTFRSYLLGALTKFLSKQYRNTNARRRKPPGTLISISEHDIDPIVDCDQFSSPENVFHHIWVAELLEKALDDCRCHFEFSSDPMKRKYWGAFYDRVLKPILEEDPPLSLVEISDKHGLPKEKLSAIMVTVKRRMRRAIVNVIEQYSAPGLHADEELEELIRLLA